MASFLWKLPPRQSSLRPATRSPSTSRSPARGNFDAMRRAFTTSIARGGSTYPPARKVRIQPERSHRFNGAKRFEYMLVAREDRSKTPVAQVSFFDPSLEKYVTIKSSPIEVAAKGTAVQAHSGGCNPGRSATSQRDSGIEAGPERKFAGLRLLPGSFTSFAYDRRFLVMNGALAAAWLRCLCAGWDAWCRFGFRQVSRRAAWYSRGSFAGWKIPKCEPAEFFDTAEKFVFLKLNSNGTAADARDVAGNVPRQRYNQNRHPHDLSISTTNGSFRQRRAQKSQSGREAADAGLSRILTVNCARKFSRRTSLTALWAKADTLQEGERRALRKAIIPRRSARLNPPSAGAERRDTGHSLGTV